MSIQAIKAVEIGLGIDAARRPGSKVMDPITYDADHPADDRRHGFRRPTNNAGGIEGGTSNGEPIVIRAAKKPISTLAARGPSVNMATKAPQPATYERSDVCAVPAASVIVENVVAFEIAGGRGRKICRNQRQCHPRRHGGDTRPQPREPRPLGRDKPDWETSVTNILGAVRRARAPVNAARIGTLSESKS